ncbi:MAG TPA: hypothetical protein VGB65_11770 [Allosphingosinicella sp.]|jgi:hypothetical protein
MRLLLLPLLIAALPAAAAPRDPARLEVGKSPEAPMGRFRQDSCKRPEVHQAEAPKPAESRKLGELPPGDLILTVYREVDGCIDPLIVRYGDGRAPAPAAPPEPVRPRARLWQ